MTRTFPPNPYRRYLEQATPDRRRSHCMQYTALCVLASVSVAVVSILAIVGWLS